MSDKDDKAMSDKDDKAMIKLCPYFHRSLTSLTAISSYGS